MTHPLHLAPLAPLEASRLDTHDLPLVDARLLPPGVAFDTPAIGRVLVRARARGDGLAHALMREAVERCQARWPGQAISLGTQSHLQRYYAAHGFEVCSDEYLEDGIPHVDMRRPASS